MLQYSKIVSSRNDWREKAVKRAEQIREYRKSQKRHQAKIAERQKEISKLKQSPAEKKTQKQS
jgi:uncharacterized protein YlxW (UPF0749 family)